MIVHRQVAGVDAGQKVVNVGFVPQQSTDKIGDSSIDKTRILSINAYRALIYVNVI